MATKKNKASDVPAENTPPASADVAPELSPAKAMQLQSERIVENTLPVTIRIDNNFEYHLNLALSVIDAILNPDVPDAFIEVPSPVSAVRRFLHTSRIKELDVKGWQQ